MFSVPLQGPISRGMRNSVVAPLARSYHLDPSVERGWSAHPRQVPIHHISSLRREILTGPSGNIVAPVNLPVGVVD